MQPTTITPKKDLYNGSRCFTKDRPYKVPGIITRLADLKYRVVVNDLQEDHTIGEWWKHFKIIK